MTKSFLSTFLKRLTYAYNLKSQKFSFPKKFFCQALSFAPILGVLLFTLSSNLHAEKGFVEPWGKDKTLVKEHRDTTLAKRKDIMSKIAEGVILFHQNIISPVDGPRSHFRPTSARYMLLAIRRHGFLKGYIKGCDRLLRENKDDWVYRKRLINGTVYKWDPTY